MRLLKQAYLAQKSAASCHKETAFVKCRPNLKSTTSCFPRQGGKSDGAALTGRPPRKDSLVLFPTDLPSRKLPGRSQQNEFCRCTATRPP